MGLDTSGFLLEGVRVATGNNAFTYPARSVVSGSSITGSGRADYMVFVAGQSPGRDGMDIGDPELRFRWTRNDTVSRFDYDAFARRWAPMPGGAPEALGKLGNSPRLIAAAAVDGATSPHAIFVGYPTRIRVFTVDEVANSSEFTTPPLGTVQLSLANGELNFSTIDIEDPVVAGLTVYAVRQSFFDRQRVKGKFGVLPDVSTQSYSLFINPIPGSGETPLVRIGFRRYLTVTAYATESLLVTPSAGACSISLDTGRILFAPEDIDAYPGDSVYYDGIVLGSSSLARHEISGITSADPRTSTELVGLSDSSRFSFFLAPAGAPAETPRYYLTPSLAVSDAAPESGSVNINVLTGRITLSDDDIALGSPSLYFVDTWVPIERGVSIQVYPSGVNTSGYPQVSDFVETYSVSTQLLQDGITGSPFLILPTVPLVDNSLKFTVQQGEGGGGTYVGDLVDGTDSTKPGLGYLTDLEAKQLKFCFRKTALMTMDKPLSSVKLPDAAISEDGVVLKKNGVAIQPGVGFDFTSTTGLIEFLDPVGENDSGNILSISGTCTLPNQFVATSPVFKVEHKGKYLYVPTGENTGFYEVTAFADSSRVFVSPPFRSTGTELVDLRTTREIIVDRFWTKLTHSLKKFSVFKMKSLTDEEAVKLTEDEFFVSPDRGQVNLTNPALPGEVYKVIYTSLDTQDEGVTVTPTSRTEFAAFKIRQEVATTVEGQSAATFNPDGDTIATGMPMQVYVNGVTQEPESFKFIAPSTLVLGSPVQGGVVTIDYWVHESPGGNRGFKLLFSPVDVDYPTIVGADGATSADTGASIFNGDKRDILIPEGVVLVDGKDLLTISAVTYDAGTDQTSVNFFPVPPLTVYNPPLQVCAPVTNSYQIVETEAVTPLPKGHNSFEVQGEREYKPGTVLTIDGDPYLAIAATYNAATDRTSIVLATSASRNYVIPTVTRSVRPVMTSGSEFSTGKPAHGEYSVTLVREGTVRKTLVRESDYTIGEAGLFKLQFDLSFGDSLSAMYVARQAQPAGTTIEANYAHAVAPNQTNGVQGQKLFGSYTLYSPDTFFYRVETVQSFIPEFLEELKKSASSSSSGPNIADRKSLQAKDMGTASLYFGEQHQANFDVIVGRLLKFYNDLINFYEDLLANLDGRVVGGTSGRFRYDGNLDNPVRTTYASITNDIDDRVKLYDSVVFTGFFTYDEVPVYAHMYEPNNLSRLFPTAQKVTVFLNDKTGLIDFGKTLGSIGIPNLSSVGILSTTPARSSFVMGTSTSQIIIPQNGDPANLIPQFSSGQKVFLYLPDGTPAGDRTITSLVGNILTLNSPITFVNGSISVDVANSSPKYYTPERDMFVNYENGQLSNFTLPPPFNSKQETVGGNELVDTDVTYGNGDVSPKRIPALDGSTLGDSGKPSSPSLKYRNETDILATETQLLSYTGLAVVQADLVTVTGYTPPVSVGQVVTFLAGSNVGLQRTIASVVSIAGITISFTVTSPFASPDSAGSLLHAHSLASVTESSVLASLVSVLSTATTVAPVDPALIGTLASEYNTVRSIIECYGPTLVSGTGSATGNVFTVAQDLTQTSQPVTNASILFIPTGDNAGVYKIAAAGSNTITVDPTAPFASFATSAPSPYIIVQPWSFLSTKQFKVLADYMASTKTFLAETQTWQSSMTDANLDTRRAQVAARQAKILELTQSLTGVLTKSDKLYDQRFLWIKQRTDKREGTVTLRQRAAEKRLEDTAKLLTDQQKLLVASQLL